MGAAAPRCGRVWCGCFQRLTKPWPPLPPPLSSRNSTTPTHMSTQPTFSCGSCRTRGEVLVALEWLQHVGARGGLTGL
eukprot:2042646-Rhodomonas_salina.2